MGWVIPPHMELERVYYLLLLYVVYWNGELGSGKICGIWIPGDLMMMEAEKGMVLQLYME